MSKSPAVVLEYSDPEHTHQRYPARAELPRAHPPEVPCTGGVSFQSLTFRGVSRIADQLTRVSAVPAPVFPPQSDTCRGRCGRRQWVRGVFPPQSDTCRGRCGRRRWVRERGGEGERRQGSEEIGGRWRKRQTNRQTDRHRQLQT